MTPLEMIAEWRKGCVDSMEYAEDGTYLGQHLHPGLCQVCTRGLIDALERKVGKIELVLVDGTPQVIMRPPASPA